MKKTLALIVTLTIALTINAVRAVNEAFPVRQGDGTTVMLYKHGHDYLAFYTTVDGYVVVRDSDGMLCYAQVVDGELTASSIVCHNIDERDADEQTYVASITLTMAEAAEAFYSSENTESNSGPSKVAATSSDGLGIYGTSADGSVPSIGEVTLPVIMVNYSDVSFQDGMDTDKLSRILNEEGYCEDNDYEVGSVRDYFIDNSRGMFTPTFDVVAEVTLSNGYAYYGANSSSSHNVRAWNMVSEAVALAVNEGVDFSKYLIDGAIPNIIVYYAGCSEATGGDEDTVWPHTATLSGTYRIMSGYTVKSYFVGNELYGSETSNRLMGIGVLCHEFSHALGLPDLYDTSSSYDDESPWGYYSVMDTGCYYNYSYAPVGYTSYERCFLGWYDMPELTEAQSVTLTDPNDDEGTYAVIIRNPDDSSEYFILENRQPGTWFGSSYSGLLVARCAYLASAWTSNIINTNQSKKRLYLVTANGELISSSTYKANHIYGNGINNKTTHEFFDGTTTTSQPIYKIILQGDGTVSFNYMERYISTTVENNDDIYELVTDASTLADNDTILFVNANDAVALNIIAQDTYYRKAVNLTLSADEAQGNDYISEFVLTGSTGAWRFYNPTKKVYLASHNSGTTVTGSKTNANAAATIEINSGVATIHYTGTATCSYLAYDTDECYFNCFEDETANLQIYRKVVDEESTGIISATISSDNSNADTAVYDTAGRYVGTSLHGLPVGIYVKGGKKYIVR